MYPPVNPSFVSKPDYFPNTPFASAQEAGGQATNPNPQIPEKFLDKKTGEIRTDALLKSYLALEKKLSQSIDPNKADPASLRSIMGVPETADKYDVKCDHGLFDADPDLNAMLHEKGFNNEQAQMVYDLAAEKLIPMVLDLAQEFQADREIERLITHFGGKEQFAETSRQLLAFGQKNFPKEVLDGMTSSFEGVMALHKMMESDDSIPFAKGKPAQAMDEKELRAMMKDPKYWRDRDPSLVKKITEGFKDIYS